MPGLHSYLMSAENGGLVSTRCQREACEAFGVSFAEAEAVILSLGLCPARYQRNRETISAAGQLALLQSRVAVLGCGGLGGYLIEELARLGVGTILALDPDVFEEHNLNRQILSRIDSLGEAKVAAAARRVAEINPAVELVPLQRAFDGEGGAELLSGATVVVDALDSVATRLELAQVCRELAIPLVHGAIAGWYCQVATQLPGEDISICLASAAGGKQGVETRLGNPSFTPAVVASLQVAEVCKVILGQGTPLAGRMLVGNLLEMEFEEMTL